MAMQLQRRLELSCEERLGFVWISRARMAESKSLIIEDAPCMEVPPDILILALAFTAGDAVLDAFREGIASDISRPAADGGGFGLGIGLVEV